MSTNAEQLEHPPRPMLRTREVLRRLSVARSTLNRLVSHGEMPEPVRVGGGLRWDPSELECAIRELKTKRGKP